MMDQQSVNANLMKSMNALGEANCSLMASMDALNERMELLQAQMDCQKEIARINLETINLILKEVK